MPLPVPALIALGAELVKLLPFGAKRPETIDKAAPILIDIARTIVASAATRWSELAPLLEYESKERAAARDFAERMTGSGPTWRQIGYGAMVAVLALGIVFGGAAMLREIYMMPTTSEQTRGNIVGFLLAMIPVVVYWVFGSSRSSQVKDATIAEQARR